MLKIDSRDLTMSIVQGDTGPFTIGVKSHSFIEGDIIHFSVKPKLDKDTPYSIQKTVSSFSNDGKAEVIIEPIDTEDLPLGKYYYDIEWVTESGEINTLMPNGYADFILKAGVTNE